MAAIEAQEGGTLAGARLAPDALRGCGTFERHRGVIDADVIRLIDNRVEESGDLLAPASV